MKSIERVLRTLKHEEPDSIPLDLGSSLVTGLTKNAYTNLAQYFGEESRKIEFYDTVQQLPIVSESILEKLGVDIRGLIPNYARKNPAMEENGDSYSFVDEWGIRWEMKKGELYFSMVERPLSGNIDEKDIDNFPWPNPSSPALFQGLEQRAHEFYQQGYPVILESLCAGIFEMSCRMRGEEQFYQDLAINPKLASKLLDKFVELKIQFYHAASERLRNHIQFIREGDDIAGQESLLISPKMYRAFIKPRHKKLFEAQRKIFPSPFYIFFHSDGAIYDLIPDFVDAGVDVLNPVQISAKDMGDTKRLKWEFGRYITFWGGGVDTQQVLPFGTPKEVEEEVKERIEDLAPGGGFIFSSVHNIQDDVPLQNIMAMYNAVKKYGKYENGGSKNG